MAERILVGVAWPYANGDLHLGQIAGCYLPADIFARYHRMKGDKVLMVSGSDQHGTPVALKAEQEGLTPNEVVAAYHKGFLHSWERLGIQFDLFTTTGTPNHAAVVYDLLETLRDKGYTYTDEMLLPYCPVDLRFLPDRYVEGICPHCSFDGARGDQCDNCGKPLNPEELIEMRCRICGSTPYMQHSEHLFFRLGAFHAARGIGESLKETLAEKFTHADHPARASPAAVRTDRDTPPLSLRTVNRSSASRTCGPRRSAMISTSRMPSLEDPVPASSTSTMPVTTESAALARSSEMAAWRTFGLGSARASNAPELASSGVRAPMALRTSTRTRSSSYFATASRAGKADTLPALPMAVTTLLTTNQRGSASRAVRCRTSPRPAMPRRSTMERLVTIGSSTVI